jgi:hypothetical protein
MRTEYPPLSAFVPKFSLREIMEAQPMKMYLGKEYYLDFKYSSNWFVKQWRLIGSRWKCILNSLNKIL